MKNALSTSISLGLKLAIFNSCDGLGLAAELAALYIPQLIVMREAIPDKVAHKFLQVFLKEYSQGKTLHHSVKEARIELKQLEQECPCISWLPVICQNPADNPPLWQDFTGSEGEVDWKGSLRALWTISTIGRLNDNFLIAEEQIGYETQEIYIPLGLVEKEKLTKYEGEEDSDSPEAAKKNYLSPEKTTKTYTQQEEFFNEVLTKGDSPKSKGQRLLIVGEGGAGKSTFLNKIANWVFDNTDGMAVWVSLADLGNLTLESYLQGWFNSSGDKVRFPANDFEAFKQLFAIGKVWLLLDAADEMQTPENNLAALASGLTDWMKQGRIVITCRQNVWEIGKEAVDDFDTYRILELNYGSVDSQEDQVGQFIERYFLRYRLEEKNNREAVKVNARQLRRQLDLSDKQRIKDLVRNPLRLSLLCSAYELFDGELPKTKAGLYEKFTKSVYRWKQDIFKTTEQEQQELNTALARLALRGIKQPYSRFRLPQHIVEEELGDLLEKALQVGWLIRVGVSAQNTTQAVYTFYHASFQEYFASLAISDGRYFLNHDNENPNPLLDPNPALEYNNGKPSYRIFESQWREVYLLWLGRHDVEEDGFIRNKYSLLESLWKFQDKCSSSYQCQAINLSTLGWSEFKYAHVFSQQVLEQLDKDSKIVARDLIDIAFGYFDKNNNLITYRKPIKLDAQSALIEIEHQVVIKALMNKIAERKQHLYNFFDIINFIFYSINPDVQLLREIDCDRQIAKRMIRDLRQQNLDTDIADRIVSLLQRINPLPELKNEVSNGILTYLYNHKHLDFNGLNYTFDYLNETAADNRFALNRLVNILLHPQTQEKAIGFEYWEISSYLEKNAGGNREVIDKLLNWYFKYWLNPVKVDYSLESDSPEFKEQDRLESLERTVSSILEKIAKNNNNTIQRVIQTIDNPKCNSSIKSKLFDFLIDIGGECPEVKKFVINIIKNKQANEHLRKKAITRLQFEEFQPSKPELDEIVALLVSELNEIGTNNDIRETIIETLQEIAPNHQIFCQALVSLSANNKTNEPILEKSLMALEEMTIEEQEQINTIVNLFLKPDIDERFDSFRSYLSDIIIKTSSQ